MRLGQFHKALLLVIRDGFLPQKRLVLEWWAILAFACLLAAFAAHSGWTQRFDNLLLDQAIPKAAPPPSDKILIVEIDERSLAEVGSWPWKRATHGKLIEKISKARPLAISYDVLFIEPGDAAEDKALTKAVSSAGNVVLPFQYQIPGSNGREIDQLLPFAPLSSAASGMGHVGLRFDADGLVRRVDIKGSGNTVPFAHLMEVTKDHGSDSHLPVRSGSTLLPLLPRSSYRTVPAASILQGQVSADFIKGKFVLVGASAQGMADIFPVAASVGSSMPGIEIQANLLNGLLANRFVEEASPTVALAVALVSISILMLAFWHLNPRTNLVLSIGLLTLLLAGAAMLTVFGRYWIAPGPALLGILLLYPLWGWRRLAALNDFVSMETSRLTGFGGNISSSTASRGLDAIALQAMRLRSVIGELTDREEFMNNVIGAAPDAMCVIDDTEKIILANSAAQALFSESLIGKSLPEVMAFEGGFLPKEGSEWTAKNGAVMLVTKSEMTAKSDDPAGMIFCLSDITAIREAERERKEMLEFLSHDMRSPQAAIVSLVDGGSQSVSPHTDLLRRIRKHAIQTLKLTEDFVQLARLDSIKLRADEHNLVELMREAIDENYALAKAKSITISHKEADEFYYVVLDGATIVRALSNLISNAIKYSPVRSTVTCRVWISELQNGSGHRAYCEIVDNGPGLPMERLKDTFGRFGYRDEAQSVGAGLGLAFVKRSVDRNHGNIECYSSASEGTKFTVSFPMTADTVSEVDTASE